MRDGLKLMQEGYFPSVENMASDSAARNAYSERIQEMKGVRLFCATVYFAGEMDRRK
jgi:hypothetical protein